MEMILTNLSFPHLLRGLSLPLVLCQELAIAQPEPWIRGSRLRHDRLGNQHSWKFKQASHKSRVTWSGILENRDWLRHHCLCHGLLEYPGGMCFPWMPSYNDSAADHDNRAISFVILPRASPPAWSAPMVLQLPRNTSPTPLK